MKPIFPLSIVGAVVLAGCINPQPMPDLSASHPASPQAAASPVPPLLPGLLAITNLVTMKPATNAPTEHQHGQPTKPKAEEKK